MPLNLRHAARCARAVPAQAYSVSAEWRVAGRAVDRAEDAEVELNEVERLYTELNMWDSAFGL